MFNTLTQDILQKRNENYFLDERELQFIKIKEKGITLVALAVTITVMLILGTISINAMFGENGVLKKAKEQGNKTKGTISESEAKTNQLMQDYENMMAGGVGNEIDEASQEIIDNLRQQIEELQKQKDELTKTNEELKAKQATGDATEDQVLSGATFSTSNGVGLTGTMPSYTSGSQAVTTSGKWGIDTTKGAWMYIPNNGYHSTSYWLNVPWSAFKEQLGTASTGNVLSGITFSSTNGVKLTGTMATLSTADWNGDKINKQVNATSTVVGNASDNDKSTEYVYFGIEKNKYTGDNQWVRAKAADLRKTLTESANAGAGQILSGYTAYVNGNKVTGTMANRSSTIQTATTSTSNTSASCYRINGSNIEVVPAIGYWGTWDWTKSCIKIPTTATLKSVTYTVNVSSSKYDFKGAYNNNTESRYYLTCDMNFPHKVVSAVCKVVSGGELSCMVGNGIVQCDGMLDLSKTHPTWNTDRYFYFPHRYNNQAQCQVTVWYV